MVTIETTSLAKTYATRLWGRGSVRALTDLSLRVEAGEIFGLLGPNGAGKTTAIKILLGVVFPTGGSATILGRSVNDPIARSRVGYLSENPRFPSHLTGGGALRMFGEMYGITGTRLTSRVKDLLHTVGMSQWKDVKVRTYSKGMLQRIGIAHALLNDPDVIFFDEPTDGVDPVGRKDIRDLLVNLKQQGKTIFLNSHLLSEVELISDRVAILRGGEKIAEGTVEQLTARDSSYEIGFEPPLPASFHVDAAARILQATVHGDTLNVTIQSNNDLNAVIDLLRSHHIQITRIQRKKETLEDVFMGLIRQESQP